MQKRHVNCIFGCSDLGAYMHRFPHPERRAELFKSWLEIVGDKLKESDPLRIYKNKMICDYHFKPEHKVSGHRLLNSAVPSRNLSGVVSTQGISVQLEHNYFVPRMWVAGNEPRTDVDFDSSRTSQKQHSMDDVEETTEFTDTIVKKYDQNMRSNESYQKVNNLEFENSNQITNIKVNEHVHVTITKDDDDEDVSHVLDFETEVPVAVTLNGSSGDSDKNEKYISEEHQGFRCNVCLGNIVGFRYRCCECEDYDMCSDCESRQQHPQHYVLRIPGNREQTEIRRVLGAIHLSLTLPDDVKEEVVIKIEDSEGEKPSDPLDTGGAIPTVIELADTEPMKTDTLSPLDILSCESCDPVPPSVKRPRLIPNKLKIVVDRNFIPVVLDALNRKAVLTLNKLVLASQNNPTRTESLHELNQGTESIKHVEEKLPTEENISKRRMSKSIYSTEIGESTESVNFSQNITENSGNVVF